MRDDVNCLVLRRNNRDVDENCLVLRLSNGDVDETWLFG